MAGTISTPYGTIEITGGIATMQYTGFYNRSGYGDGNAVIGYPVNPTWKFQLKGQYQEGSGDHGTLSSNGAVTLEMGTGGVEWSGNAAFLMTQIGGNWGTAYPDENFDYAISGQFQGEPTVTS